MAHSFTKSRCTGCGGPWDEKHEGDYLAHAVWLSIANQKASKNKARPLRSGQNDDEDDEQAIYGISAAPRPIWLCGQFSREFMR